MMMDKGCLGDGGCVEQVAEMRPFLLDGITGVKNSAISRSIC